MTSISIAVSSVEVGEVVASFLTGKTYMDLVVYVSSYPCIGNERVHVSTTREETSEEELSGMVLSLLATAYGNAVNSVAI